jgi:hypothetical protein
MSTIAYWGIALVAVVMFVILAYARSWAWTGFTAAGGRKTNESPSTKTLWDWLQLLIIPLGLAAVAFAFNDAHTRRDQKREDARVSRERSIAADARREESLRTYLQQMSDLMLRHRLRASRGSTEGEFPPSDVQVLARTLTLTVLGRLDPARKGLVVRFLYEARLLDDSSGVRGDVRHFNVPAVDLADADLRRVSLRGATLQSFVGPEGTGAGLSGADLGHADFRDADVEALKVQDADLRGADFSGADLHLSIFSRACVSGARFVETNLTSA